MHSYGTYSESSKISSDILKYTIAYALIRDFSDNHEYSFLTIFVPVREGLF